MRKKLESFKIGVEIKASFCCTFACNSTHNFFLSVFLTFSPLALTKGSRFIFIVCYMCPGIQINRIETLLSVTKCELATLLRVHLFVLFFSLKQL